jgi:1,2-diacylglycerol 3-alpha-glucosyltransferase
MANVVTAPTQELTNELKSYGLHNVINIPNGIDFKKLKCRKSEINEFKKQHMIPSDKKIILYLGRVSFEKRLKQLVEAFKKIESNDTCLVIAGSGPHIEEIKKLCEKMRVKNIRFTGFVKNPALAYSCADVFVSASDSETFGLTFVEAMYFGLPVIGVRKFGPKELIKEGKVGFLVEPNDPNELARAIERIVSNDRIRREMGLEAKKTAKKYSIENSVKKMLEIYKKLAVNYPRLKPWACRLDDTHPQQ